MAEQHSHIVVYRAWVNHEVFQDFLEDLQAICPGAAAAAALHHVLGVHEPVCLGGAIPEKDIIAVFQQFSDDWLILLNGSYYCNALGPYASSEQAEEAAQEAADAAASESRERFRPK